MAVRRGGYSRWMNTPRIIMESCLQNDQTILCIMCFALTSWAFESRNLIDGVHDDPSTIRNCWTTVLGIPSKQHPHILITSYLLLQRWCLPPNWLHYQCRIPGCRDVCLCPSLSLRSQDEPHINTDYMPLQTQPNWTMWAVTKNPEKHGRYQTTSDIS